MDAVQALVCTGAITAFVPTLRMAHTLKKQPFPFTHRDAVSVMLSPQETCVWVPQAPAGPTHPFWRGPASAENKGFDESVCLAAVKELVNTGYIDDRRASRKVIAARSGKKQESRNYMLQRFLEAGIDSDIAEEIAAGLDDDVDTCKSLYEANFGTPEEDYSDREDEFIKLAQLRGYGLELSRKAFRMYLDSE